MVSHIISLAVITDNNLVQTLSISLVRLLECRVVCRNLRRTVLGSRDYYLVVSHIISLAVITDNNIVQTLMIPLCVYLDVGLFAETYDRLLLGFLM